MSEQPIPWGSPLRFVIRDAGQGDAHLCCPVCGSAYVHPARVVVDQSQTRTEVTREMTVVTPSEPGNVSRRGSLISTQLWCEQGHAFEYRLTFHKGSLLCEMATWQLADDAPREELWRD